MALLTELLKNRESLSKLQELQIFLKEQETKVPLVPKKVTVHREGKTFQRTQMVRPEEAEKIKEKPSSEAKHPAYTNIKTDFPEADKYIYPVLAKLPPEHISKELKINDGSKEKVLEHSSPESKDKILHHGCLGYYDLPSDSIYIIPEAKDSDFTPYYGAELKDKGLSLYITHEYAHHIDIELGLPVGAREAVWKQYEKGKGVTWYAGTSVQEYFAESYSFYVNAPEELKKKDPSMYDILKEKVFNGREY